MVFDFKLCFIVRNTVRTITAIWLDFGLSHLIVNDWKVPIYKNNSCILATFYIRSGELPIL